MTNLRNSLELGTALGRRGLFGRFLCASRSQRTAAVSVVVGCLVAMAPAAWGEATFRVLGHGDEDNTAAIQQAFDSAVAAGPGSVVELAGCDFHDSVLLNSWLIGKARRYAPEKSQHALHACCRTCGWKC